MGKTMFPDGISGLPLEGATGQVLAKASAADNDTEWVDSSGGGSLVLPISLVPVMTSNTDPSGVASASSSHYSVDAWWGFNPDTYGWVTTGSGFPCYLQYQFATAQIVKGYSITPWSFDTFPIRSPTAWHLDGSNDNKSWTVLDTRTSLKYEWSPYVRRFFNIATPASYLYYRLVITANGGDTYSGAVAHMGLYADPV